MKRPRPLTLRQWLDATGFSLAWIADRAGVSLSTAYRWRSGRAPSLAHAQEIERATNGCVPASVWTVRT